MSDFSLLASSVRRNRTQPEVTLKKKWHPGNYLYVSGPSNYGMAPEGTSDDQIRAIVADNQNWAGYHSRYEWRYLEPSFGVYDFSKIEEDLARTAADGKVLTIMVNERTFYDRLVFPGPSYMNVNSPDFDAAYTGYYYIPAGYPNGIFPNLWKPLFLERMTALINALGAAFNDEPAFAGISFPETAVVNMQDEVGFTGAAYRDYLIGIHNAASIAFPDCIVQQLLNWRGGMSPTEANQMMTNAVEKGVAIGAADLSGINTAQVAAGVTVPDTFLDNQFGDHYRNLRGVVPLINSCQSPTFNIGTPSGDFDFATENGVNSLQWVANRGIVNPTAYTIYDVIDEIDRRVAAGIPTLSTLIPESLIA